MKRSGLLFSIILLFTGVSAKAGDDLSLQIFRQIYNQQYDSARILLNENEPDRFYRTVLEIDLSYWENVTGTDKPDYPAFEKTLQKYDSYASGSQEDKVVSLVVLSYQLRYEFKRRSLFSALQTRKKTLELYDELKQSEIKLNKNQAEIFDLYNALLLYFNHYPGKYLSKKSRQQTQTTLEKMEFLTHSKSEMTKTLSSYFLGKIYLQYEKEAEKGIRLFEYLSRQYPHNSKFPEYLEACSEEAD